MIKAKNLATGEINEVWYVNFQNGAIVGNSKKPSAKFLEKFGVFVHLAGSTDEGYPVYNLNDGFELVVGRTRRPKPAKPAQAQVEVASTNTEEIAPVAVEEPASEPVEVAQPVEEATAEVTEAKPKPKRTKRTKKTPKPAEQAQVEVAEASAETATEPHENVNVWEMTEDCFGTSENVVEGYALDYSLGMSAEAIKAELLVKYGSLGADVFDAVCKVCKIQPASLNEKEVDRMIEAKVEAKVEAKMKTMKPQGEVVTINIDGETHTVSGKVTEKFKAICTTVKKNYPLYMWGDAGTGKSHTAKQVAEALGLDFYESQQVLFSHEMKGYGDASGSYVPTPFYKAFTKGGLFFLDEIDASQPEALVVLNTAIANRRFDFPVIGNVTAHPDFRVIAAGNTRMTGADIEYTARSVQDASTKNRFFFTHVDYTPEIEDALAGDEVEIAKFCRDLRQAKNKAQINLCVSYRQIQTLADKDMQEAWGLEDLLRGGVFKELEADEIRMLYGYLEDKDNRWAKAVAKMI